LSDRDEQLKKQVGGQHYKGFVIQPMEYCHVNNIPYVDGNIIKYVSRWRVHGSVDGRAKGLVDLEKALHYLEFLIADEKAKVKAPPRPQMKPVIDEEEIGPGTPADGGHHARQADE
jgi:hypothetical protein